LTSNMMTTKQYFLVNLSKFVVELVGTSVLQVFFLTLGPQQSGILLGMWIINLFGVAISGAHFNPGVTLCSMLRRNSTFGSRRLLGVIYIVAQFLGGIGGAMISKFLMNQAEGSNLAVSPYLKWDSENKLFEYRNFPALISEFTGSAFFIFIIMICTDKKTQFSEDRVINCFIMASAYVSARLIGGGPLVTTLYSSPEI
jgi:glycerol uptake facilitator-like aquaporin